ncbi:MAG: hypothetical protein PUG68_03600 [Lachnospiraceae bacterium]|nr:hypothetical protein [Lachnospiraceae bacterium]MDD7326874.1 hypothetical protein [Lachnospiraceae bacterium]MDY2759543.1 hypothetical protein [Lachnospiraceae bacterium]
MRTRKKIALVSVIMTAVCILAAFVPVVSAHADTITSEDNSISDPKEITPVVLDDACDIEKMEPAYSMNDITLKENMGYQEYRYLSFDLMEDSWVYMSGGFSLNSHDGASVHVDIYGSSAYTRKIGEYGWGYWEYEKKFCGFLKKGTYYMEIKAKQSNYGDYTGNVDLYAARIPVSKVFTITQKLSKGKKSVKVTLNNRLAGYMKYVQYKEGKIGSSRIYSENTWIYMSSGFYLNSDAATLLKNKNDRYSFTVKKNGKYTIMVTDSEGSRCQKVVSVKGIRKNAKKRK